MTIFRPFEMERWQSLHENRVASNLSESGVHPLSLRELLALAGDEAVLDTPLGYGQSNGTDELRARIAGLYGGAADPERVVVCNGSAEANFLVAWELVRPGDEVAIIVPTYMQTHGLATNAGARVVEIHAREALGWQPDPDEVRAAVTERTRLLVVTNPGNPTGAVLHDDVRAAIIEATARTGTWVLSDEVYAGAEVDGPETTSLLGAHERVIATGSLSKAYGLAGLRIGWAASVDAGLAAQVWARSDYTTISTGELTDRLARVALDPAVRPRLLQRTRGIIREGIAIVEAWLGGADAQDAQRVDAAEPQQIDAAEHQVDAAEQQRHRGWQWRRPDAGAIALLRYEGGPGSDVLAERLRQEGVLVVPGTHFGLGRYIRTGLGIRPDELREGLARIATVHGGQASQIRT
jgi:aspartate/methionine/tyrosine aminotransferase